MKEIPILFSAEMIQAILRKENSKTVTRRIIKPQPPNDNLGYIMLNNGNALLCGADYPDGDDDEIKCPYGKVGDILWVKQTHYRFGHWIKNGISKAGRQKWKFIAANANIKYPDDPPQKIEKNNFRGMGWYKRSPLFMPKEACRIKLKITDVRVEKLQDITEGDIWKEGISIPVSPDRHPLIQLTGKYPACEYFDKELKNYAHAYFYSLWDILNAERGYPVKSNPYVWRIEFERLK